MLGLSWARLHAAPAPAAAPAMAITFAEGAPRLVRDKSWFQAGRGVVLRANDMLEAGAGALQLAAGGTTIALGPASRIFIRGGSEVVLLSGWLKVRAPNGQSFTVVASSTRMAASGATFTVYATADATELFAEAGEVLVEEPRAGKARRSTTVAREQFAVRSGAPPLRRAPRPPAAFLAAMPPGFRDETVALAAPAPAAPKFDRAASFAELAPWVADQPSLRRQVQVRFEPPRPPRRAISEIKATP